MFILRFMNVKLLETNVSTIEMKMMCDFCAAAEPVQHAEPRGVRFALLRPSRPGAADHPLLRGPDA